MSGKIHLLFWLIVTVASILVTPILFSADQITNRARTEIASVTSAFGREKAESIVASADSVYRALFIETNMIGGVKRTYATEDDMRATEGFIGLRAAARVTNAYLLALSVNFYSMSLRVLTLLTWLPLILPFVAAAAFDGWTARAIKLCSFQFNSPISYSVGLHLVIASLAVPVLYLIVPITVSAWWIPTWALFFGAALILMIKNTNRISSDGT